MMKRMLVLVCALLLVVSISATAFADEILFRSAPWFGTYETTMAVLSDSNISWGSPSSALGKYVLDEVEERSSNYDRNYQCICTVNSISKQTTLKVAGYSVSNIKLYFAYTPNSAGQIDHKVENTSFYMAKYTIRPNDYTVVSADLKQKLTGIYGAPVTIENSNDCASGNATYYRWNGSNGSFVVLTREDTSYSGEPEIYIFYGNDKGTDLIKNAESIQRAADADTLRNAGSDGL